MWAFGIIFVALGVAIAGKANLGVSMIAAPVFVLHEWISAYVSFLSLGTIEYIFQGIMLIIMCIIVKKFNWRYILAFAAAVIYGYTLDLFVFLLGSAPLTSLALRWVMLFLSDLSVAFGVACCFRTYMPLQVYELFVAEVAAKFNMIITKVKRYYDLTLLIVSILLALILFGDVAAFDRSKIASASFHNIGLGTIVTTFINAPLIALWTIILNKISGDAPLFPKLKKIIGR